MRIVISGADGFLGSHIIRNLEHDKEFEIIGLTVFPEELSNKYKEWDNLTILEANTDTMLSASILDNADVYLACAFPRAVGQTNMGSGLDFVYESLNLLIEKGCKSIINVSSQSVYDPYRTVPATESDAVVLTSEYAVAKYCVELSLRMLCRRDRIPYTSIRMASLIGPGFNQRFVNKMVQSAIENHKITVADNGSKFGFLDVEDAAAGFQKLLKSNPIYWKPVYNLGITEAYTVTQIAITIAEEFRKKAGKVIEIQKEIADGRKSNSAIETSLIREIIGCYRNKSLSESVNNIIEYEFSRRL